MAVTLGSMDWRLGVDNAGFQSGLANAEKQAKGFGTNITKALATGAKVAFGAAVVGVGALGVVLGQSVKEAMAAEEITAQLNAAIKSTGGIAGVSAKAIQDHALALSQVTRFEDDAIVSANALLLTFTNIGKDVFPKATVAILDVATAFKMDLTSAAKMVGKALNDPKQGLTALSKAGVQFTEDQKAMIAKMVEAGDIAGAQTLILKELEIQTGGSAEAAGKTMAGQMDILKNALGNVKEEIGGALIPVFKDLLTWIGPKLTAGLQKFSDWFRNGLGDLKEFAGQLGKAKDMIGDMIGDVNKGEKIKWQDLMSLAGLFTNQNDIQKRFATIVTDIQNAITNIKAAFESGGLGGVFELAWKSIGNWWASDAVPFAAELGDKIEAWWSGTFIPALQSIDWLSIGAAMTGAWNTLRDWWTTEAIPFATEVANSITTWFTTKVIPVLQTQAPLWGEKLADVLKSVITINGMMLSDDATLAYTLGAGLMQLFIEGTKAALKVFMIGPMVLEWIVKQIVSLFTGEKVPGQDSVGTAIGDFFSGAFDAVGMNIVPDMLDIGAQIVNGLKQGITDAAADFKEWIVAWAKEIIPAPLWKFFGIESPSKLMAEMGRNLVLGLAQGIQVTGPVAANAMAGVMGGMSVPSMGGARYSPSMTTGASGGSLGYAGNGGALTPITVNVYAAGGGPEFVRKAASQGVNEALRSRGYR